MLGKGQPEHRADPSGSSATREDVGDIFLQKNATKRYMEDFDGHRKEGLIRYTSDREVSGKRYQTHDKHTRDFCLRLGQDAAEPTAAPQQTKPINKQQHSQNWIQFSRRWKISISFSNPAFQL